MARIPYAAETTHPESAALAEDIRKQRSGKLLNLYRMLLNSPPIARGWLNLLTAVRQQAELAGHYREMVILRVALLNGAEYEYKAHIPYALQAGLSRAQIDDLAEWHHSEAFDAIARAVLAYADSMTREVQVPDHIFDAVAQHFNHRAITELTATIATYNMVSRFLEALHIDPEN